MGQIVVHGAKLQCPFGTKPSSLCVTSQTKCMIGGKPAATIQDMQPNANIASFGMCSSLANPQVASATAAALGVLTPQQCTMLPAGPWIPVKPNLLVDKKPCLCSDSKLICAMGMGVVSIVSAGQSKAVV